MKRVTLVVIGLGAITALAIAFVRPRVPADSAAPEFPTETASEPVVQEPFPANDVLETKPVLDSPSKPSVRLADAIADRMPEVVPVPRPRPEEFVPGFNQSVETLVSKSANHEQKQAALKQLRNAGRLDQTIAELEQRSINEPQSAEAAAALGMAYWHKTGTIKDMREQAILVMKADQSFETALKLDPSNWEARFNKAYAMSYWPAELGKGQEVIEQLRMLIEQQEAQSPQPHFAQPYAVLGEEYRKAGYPEYAAQVWQRGAALFPGNSELKKKLATQ